MEIVHVAAECYPVAKVGGLGDVAGALPKYQAASGHLVKVVMPMYRTKFLYDNQWDLVYESKQQLGSHSFHYSIIKERTNKLGFELYLVDISNLLDREKVYGYDDDNERFISFQIAVCDWLTKSKQTPDIIHCHDHHSGLIPFMVKYCFAFNHNLAAVPTVFTIHNAQYQGWLGWDKYYYLPPYDSWRYGLLDWKDTINPMASAVKCAWRVTTVSPGYLDELMFSANGLENLLNAGLQLIWQTGKSFKPRAFEKNEQQSVSMNEFITQMEYAYAAADMVVARSGAMTVSELCVVKKPVLFVPYPYAAEDHQMVNAMKLVDKNAAMMVKDNEAINKIVPMIIKLAKDERKQDELKNNIAQLAIIDADNRIADEIIKAIR